MFRKQSDEPLIRLAFLRDCRHPHAILVFSDLFHGIFSRPRDDGRNNSEHMPDFIKMESTRNTEAT